MHLFVTSPRLLELNVSEGPTQYLCPFLECGFSSPHIVEINHHCQGIPHTTHLSYSPESQAGQVYPVYVIFGVSVSLTGQPFETLLTAVQTELRSRALQSLELQTVAPTPGCPYGCQLESDDDLTIVLHVMYAHADDTESPYPTPPSPRLLPQD